MNGIPASDERITVVIPVGPNVDHLSAQLDSLGKQQYDGDKYLVISSDGSPVEYVREISSFLTDMAWTVEIVHSSVSGGPSAARNRGWKVAKTDIVLFCDSDDVLSSRWVASMAASLREHSLVGGQLETKVINEPALGRAFPIPRGLSSKWGEDFTASSNLGMRKELLVQLNGFDENLKTAEDIDLCWRASRLGFPVRYVEDAIVHYRLRESKSKLFKQAYSYAAGDAALKLKYPEYSAHWGAKYELTEFLSAVKLAFQYPFLSSARKKFAYRVGGIYGRRANHPSRRPIS